MERNHYFIIFPNEDQQQIYHFLKIGDIVDINGNICLFRELDPKKIAYKVSGFKKEIFFKDISWYYKLELLSANEVKNEIGYQDVIKKKTAAERFLNKMYKKLEKKKKEKKSSLGEL